MSGDAQHIGTLLLEDGLLTREKLDSAIKVQEESGAPLARVLVEEGIVEEVELVKALARHIGIEFVDLNEVDLDPAAVALLPEALATRYSAIPIGFKEEALVVAMADPGNVLIMDDIRAVTGLQVVPRVATKSQIERAVAKMASLGDSVADLTDLTADEDEADLSGIDAAVDDAPVVKLVNTLISRAVGERVSDIHIEPGEHDLRVRFRVDGVLHEVMTTPKSVAGALVSRLKIMADVDIAERRVPQDGRVSLRVGNRPIDLRVATLPSIYGEKVVMRILDKNDSILTLEQLGFLPQSLERFKQSYTKPYGAILVTGPTGSGKTTTLYSTLGILNEPDVNIITVEDPVEYRLPGLTQVQVNRKAGLLFSTALKSILRSDPDIVLIGEIRDVETAKIAVEAALTGHLVLSTLHTNDAASSVGRLVDMGVEPYLVSSAVDCILAQRLARRLCDRCKEPMEVTEDLIAQMGVSEEGDFAVHKAVGCSACGNTGYRGRVSLNEILLVSEEIQRMAVERRPSDEIKDMAIEQGMLTLRQDGMEKVKRGFTTLEEILRVVV